MRALLIVILVGLINSICYTQNNKSINDVRNIFDEKGDYYFDKKEYKKAVVYYNMAYESDMANYYSILRKAEAYTAMELYDQAAECYRIIFETNLYVPNEFRLQFALLLLNNKNISGFEKRMAEYNEIVSSEISGYLTANDVRAKMYKDSSILIVENESVLNTAESEIAPFVYKDVLLFSSTRKNLAATSANEYHNIFSASYLKDGRLGKLNSYNSSLNSTQSESSIAIAAKMNKLYFSRNEPGSTKIKTYSSSVPSDVNSRLDINEFTIAGFSSIGHVCFNNDGSKIYFVSDAPGGYGGLDIYSSDFSGGKWSQPVNLGSGVNSSNDETYPYVLNDTLLYFSSNGHKGFGGFDLYSYRLNHEDSSPSNLGSKVNSKYDDYSLSFSPKGLTGYFCSNRPGGFGKEDIYRIHLLNIKVKLAAYKFKRKSSLEDDKINLYLSDGEEYNIASEDKSGFNFTFKPEEAYKMVIQHENPIASNIIYNTKLTDAQMKKAFLSPAPFNKVDIRLDAGMQYQFTAGMKPISEEYKAALNTLSAEYQNTSSTIDLTALAKELLLKEGEIYTIRFVKDDHFDSDAKTKEVSTLSLNQETISVSERSFFIVLPLDVEANFNIKTDLVHFKETYNPKKVGAVKVDDAPVIKEETEIKAFEGFPILVNTSSFSEVSKRKIKAKEFTIVPGTMYILTLATTSTLGTDKEPQVIIPLTKGVQYNLGTEAQSEEEYNKALAQLSSGSSQASKANEELIDISVLSKELDIISEGDIAFSLTPAKKLASQTSDNRNVLTTLNVDGRKYFMTTMQKVEVNLTLDQTKKVNIQTDLSYVKENFVPSTIALNVDTSSFNRNLAEKKKTIITDPVFDVVVINFNLNDYSIRPDAKTILAEKVISVLKGDSRLYVTIKGYTDALGDADYNEKLSRNRAQAVKDFLNNNGIVESRIRTFSYGESMALMDGRDWEDLSEEELQKHRKVEIVIYLPK